jgi:hypothetical protein
LNELPDKNVLDFVFTAPAEVLGKDSLFFSALSAAINELITQDFERLVSLLYRLDINENKLKYLLAQQHNSKASDAIAALVIERQLQKIKSRQENRRDINDIDDEEKW